MWDHNSVAETLTGDEKDTMMETAMEDLSVTSSPVCKRNVTFPKGQKKEEMLMYYPEDEVNEDEKVEEAVAKLRGVVQKIEVTRAKEVANDERLQTEPTFLRESLKRIETLTDVVTEVAGCGPAPEMSVLKSTLVLQRAGRAARSRCLSGCRHSVIRQHDEVAFLKAREKELADKVRGLEERLQDSSDRPDQAGATKKAAAYMLKQQSQIDQLDKELISLRAQARMTPLSGSASVPTPLSKSSTFTPASTFTPPRSGGSFQTPVRSRSPPQRTRSPPRIYTPLSQLNYRSTSPHVKRLPPTGGGPGGPSSQRLHRCLTPR